ncbi:hypothetical protein ACSQ67_009512 [Phaseolus vulgaris]
MSVLLFLTVLFLVVDAKVEKEQKKKSKDKEKHKNKDKDKDKSNNNDINKLPGVPKFVQPFPEQALQQGNVVADGGGDVTDFKTNSIGSWEVLNNESGVSAMQIQLMPDNTMNVYDATVYRVSRLKYPEGMKCVQYYDENLKQNKDDCFAHAMTYDIKTNKVRALTVITDPWCSCGGLMADGTLVVAGGWSEGAKTTRYYGGQVNCETCDWREYPKKLKEDRWYATQTLLPDGNYIVIGGRRSFSYEFFPREGQPSSKTYFFPFLYETSDIDENNLYPFVHLSTDGNLFVFANNRSILINPNSNKVVRLFPVLPGGSRNYPASGMSVILPLKLDASQKESANIKVEVMVCGGNSYDSFNLAETLKQFVPALKDCGRMVITDPSPKWDIEQMPSARTMGDLLILPNGQFLFINGAQKGTAAWWDADDPNLTPVLYMPEKPKGGRFKEMTPTTISRMYHSTSAVLPNTKIWVGGSNTHNTYKDVDKFPTETRIEAFSPPYLDPKLDPYRPEIVQVPSEKMLTYGNNFQMQFKMQDMNQALNNRNIKVTMYFPPFTTHGFSMNQRLLLLQIINIQNADGVYKVMSKAPPFREVAPPGYYIIFVVYRGVPSQGMWVHLQ